MPSNEKKITFEEEGLCDLYRLSKYHKFDPVCKEKIDQSDGVIVVLGPPLFALSMIQTGSRLFPKNFYFALHHSWIAQQSVPCGAEKKNNLFLRAGVRLDQKENGKFRFMLTDFDSQKPPIMYFVNFLGPNAWSEYPEMLLLSRLSIGLEKKFIGAISSSMWLERDINDKLFTRCLMKEDGKITVPDFIAFKCCFSVKESKNAVFNRFVKDGTLVIVSETMPLSPTPDEEYGFSNRLLSMSDPTLRRLLRDSILKFIKQNSQYDEIVVKPSGTRFCGCSGVKIFNVSKARNTADEAQIELISSHIVTLLRESRREDSVLVDGRIKPPCIKLNSSSFNGPESFKQIDSWDWVLRVVCSRSLKSKHGITSGALARVAKYGIPVNAGSEGGFWASVENAFERAGIQYKGHGEKSLLDLGANFFSCWDKFEQARVREDEEPLNSATDMVGLDVMIDLRCVDGEMIPVPVIIEVNDHDCGGSDAFDLLNPNRKGALLESYLEHAFSKGKKVMQKNISLYGKAVYSFDEKSVINQTVDMSEATMSIQEENCKSSDSRHSCNSDSWPLSIDNLYHCYAM